MAQTQVLNLSLIGEYTNRLEYISQSVIRALTTPLGSVPGRINYGSKLHEMINYPVSRKLEIINACFEAIDNSTDFWIKPLKITAQLNGFRKWVITPLIQDTMQDKDFELRPLEF